VVEETHFDTPVQASARLVASDSCLDHFRGRSSEVGLFVSLKPAPVAQNRPESAGQAEIRLTGFVTIRTIDGQGLSVRLGTVAWLAHEP
jgi:hypothetical protein